MLIASLVKIHARSFATRDSGLATPSLSTAGPTARPGVLHQARQGSPSEISQEKPSEVLALGEQPEPSPTHEGTRAIVEHPPGEAAPDPEVGGKGIVVVSAGPPRIVSAKGSVVMNGAQVTANTVLQDRAALETGTDGFAIVALQSGLVIAVKESSRVAFRFRDKSTLAALSLLYGRAEVLGDLDMRVYLPNGSVKIRGQGGAIDASWKNDVQVCVDQGSLEAFSGDDVSLSKAASNTRTTGLNLVGTYGHMRAERADEHATPCGTGHPELWSRVRSIGLVP
ncbi:MAG: hypothetical protein H7Z43_11625 [Clostridia bacterium]|nr:hypothetical protein [Deltaproteobacteria bacterium]